MKKAMVPHPSASPLQGRAGKREGYSKTNPDCFTFTIQANNGELKSVCHSFPSFGGARGGYFINIIFFVSKNSFVTNL
jgi:hypothetical protein